MDFRVSNNRRSLYVAVATSVWISAASGTVYARKSPVAAAGTEGLVVIVTSTDPVIATYEGENNAKYSDDLYLMLDASGNPGDDGNPANDRFIFNNHASPIGSTVNLGSFPIGTELIF